MSKTDHTFSVTGMTCGHCERAVTQAVKKLDPQAEINIDRPANSVKVESTQPREALAAAIAAEGYEVAV
ncbi:heavy-metal-associated domain-containing protein [Ottowia thiooxydans]|uniref:heavy-metal-associated domain-containing protein n=1 Tax=Ottowia thiooxydans TaxID=219182 RepID=UPI00042A0D84|nr:heavy-metal-associated domain-containing protein [Ottowia thiooxydans]